MPVRTIPILLADNTIPIPEEQVPLAGVFDSGSWAVINLVVSSLAFLTFLMLAIVLLFRFYRRDITAASDADSLPGLGVRLLLFNNALPWLVISALSAMLVVFLFAFSQDFNGLMLVTDRWSTAIASLFIVQVLSTIITLIRSAHTVDPDREFDLDSDLDRSTVYSNKSQRLKLRSEHGHFEDDEAKDE
ncbi:MAG: hypothetical protein LBG68_03355 [Coriobacteriales bacterium]|jgi:hypothetical protein|nr:hypothetical protein [Coriobacteriales bacterium]